MKTLFLTVALLVISFAQAQDFSFINSANKADETTALQIAQNIASNAKTKFRLYKAKENKSKDGFRVVYAPDGTTDEQIKEQGDYKGCLIVDFAIFYDGKSAELQTPGTKTYKLQEVTASYLDVFPSWQKYFKPDAEVTKTVTDFKSQNLRDSDKKINFRMQKVEDNIWTLYNQS